MLTTKTPKMVQPKLKKPKRKKPKSKAQVEVNMCLLYLRVPQCTRTHSVLAAAPLLCYLARVLVLCSLLGLSCCRAPLVSCVCLSLGSLSRELSRRVWNSNLRPTKRPTRRPSCRRALRSMRNRKPCKLTPRTTRRRIRARRRLCSATNGWLQYLSGPRSLQFFPWSSSSWYSLRPASCGQSTLTVELRCVSLSRL